MNGANDVLLRVVRATGAWGLEPAVELALAVRQRRRREVEQPDVRSVEVAEMQGEQVKQMLEGRVRGRRA